MKDIAREAGVSSMTVSRVLRNDPKHQGAVREKVLAVALALGYKKNPFVAELMSRVRRRAGGEGYRPKLALLHSLGAERAAHPNLLAFRRALVARAGELGCGLELFPFQGAKASPGRQLDVLKARGIRGIIFEHVNAGGLWGSASFEIDLSEFASVAISHSITKPLLHRVVPSDYGNARLAFTELTKRGFERIGLVEDAQTCVVNMGLRSAAVREAQVGLPKKRQLPNLITRFGPTLSDELAEWMDRFKPEVVLLTGGQITEWMRSYEKRSGRSVQLIYLDWHTGLSGMTGVDPQWGEIGRVAVDQLIDQLSRNEYGVPAFPRVTEIQGTWVEGEEELGRK